MKNADGSYVGFWGAMSDETMSFMPWTDDFSRGLYLAEILVYKLQNWCKMDIKKSTRNGGNYHGYELCLLCKGRTGRKVWL